MFYCEYCKSFKSSFFYWTPSVAASVICKMIYWFLRATNVAFKWVNPFSHGMHCIITVKKKAKKKKGGFKLLYRKDLEEFRVKTKIFWNVHLSIYLQNSVIFGAFYSRCQRLQGLLMSQKKFLNLLFFFLMFL